MRDRWLPVTSLLVEHAVDSLGARLTSYEPGVLTGCLVVPPGSMRSMVPGKCRTVAGEDILRVYASSSSAIKNVVMNIAVFAILGWVAMGVGDE